MISTIRSTSMTTSIHGIGGLPMRDAVNDHSQRPRRKRRYLERVPYVPGAYDKLLAPREWQPPASILAFVIECDGDTEHPELTIIEHTRTGEHPAHHITPDHEPLMLELMLADGRSAIIDISFSRPDPVLTGFEHTPEDMFIDLREAAELLRFSNLEEPEDIEDE